MKGIEVLEDDTRYFGHALITFHDAQLSEGPHRLFVSRKSTDTPYLGPDGWQASPVAMDVEVVSRSGSKVVLRAGPSICDRIPYSLYVKLQIEGSEAFGQAFWPEIMPSPKGYSGTLSEIADPPIPDEITDVVEGPLEPPSPPPEVPNVPLKPEPEPEVKAEVPVAPRTRRSHAWLYMLLLLLVGGVGVLYWQLDNIERDLFDLPFYETTYNPSPPAVDTPSETLSAKFERLKLSDQDGDELLALSEEAFQDGDRGVAQQAIELSVQRGNAAAKITQAKWYDPRTFNSERAQAIDANRAARAYFELALAGNNEARTLLTSICEASKSGGGQYQDFFGSTYCQGNLDP